MGNSLTDAQKTAIGAGTLCYVCSIRTPLASKDEFGGHSCQQCRGDLASMRLRYALAGSQFKPQGAAMTGTSAENHFVELDQLNQNHPHYQTVPVRVIGIRHNNGVLDRCYVRKLNGRSNAWEGWIPAHKLQFLTQNDADAVASLSQHLQEGRE